MRHVSLLFALSLSVSCSSRGGASDGGARDDAAALDAGLVADAAHGTDGAAALDAATGDAGTCGALGGAHVDLTCGRSSGGFATEVAFMLDDASAPRVRILGYGLGSTGPCAVVDHVAITGPSGAMLAAFDSGGASLADVGNGGWLEGPATAAAAAFCAHDTDRFDAVTLALTGRGEGSSFTSTCGGSSLGWPPSLVVTCHHGLPPSRPLGFFMPTATDTSFQSWLPSDHAVTVTGIDPDVQLITEEHGGASSTQTFSGWRFHFWTTDVSGHAPFNYSYQIGADGDVLGALCVTPVGMPPPMAPVVIVRFTGMTDTGQFSTEVYSEGCYRMR